MIDKETIMRIARESGAVLEVRHLTNTSGNGIVFTPEELQAFANSVAAATVSRLAAGVSMEPIAYEEFAVAYANGKRLVYEKTANLPSYIHIQPLYTATAIAAARVAENERCLALMDSIGCDWRDAGDVAKFYAANYLCDAIRALMGKEQS